MIIKNKKLDNLWKYACTGNINALKKYYNSGGKVNQKIEAFGFTHSLIMGALRNKEYDTVKYLQSVGETILPSEQDAYNTLIADAKTK